MKHLTRKIFSLGELKHGYLLLLSVAVCAVTFYIDERVNPEDQLWLSLSYYASFTIAAGWSMANYAGHMRMNGLYRKQHDIGAYVEQLALSRDDKLELRGYLEDYAQDLEQNGMTGEAAAKAAIDQFRVREFLSMSKHSMPFESHGHHYLLGYAALLLAAAVLAAVIGGMAGGMSLYGIIALTVLTVYGLSLAAVFALYRLLDSMLYRKLRNYFN